MALARLRGSRPLLCTYAEFFFFLHPFFAPHAVRFITADDGERWRGWWEMWETRRCSPSIRAKWNGVVLMKQTSLPPRNSRCARLFSDVREMTAFRSVIFFFFFCCLILDVARRSSTTENRWLFFFFKSIAINASFFFFFPLPLFFFFFSLFLCLRRVQSELKLRTEHTILLWFTETREVAAVIQKKENQSTQRKKKKLQHQQQ